MDSKGGNPFLMDDYDGIESNDNMAGQASNPFLQDFGDASGTSGGGENPFLNFGGDQSYHQSSAITVDSTNPFASFATDSSAPSTGFEAATTDATTANIFSTEAKNIFVTSGDEPNLFDAPLSSHSSEEFFGQTAPPPSPATVQQPAQQPKNARAAPSRPPPPRPQPPAPPKNTKDLILSVTGAMDATSNHLLDRLQATRTPSPTLMHSPSPTPEHSFADFLDVDSNVPDLMSDDNSKAVEPPKNRDILDLFDAPNTDTTTTTIFSSSTITEDTTSSGTGVTLISATTQDNPFVGITEQQASPVQQADEFQETASVASEKRLSVSSTTGAVGSDTERAGVDADLAADALQSSSELFSTTEQLSTSVTESTFFSVADTTPPVVAPFSTPMRTSAAQSLFTTSEISSAQPSGPFASDLLGDFGEPTDTARSTSPTPGV